MNDLSHNEKEAVTNLFPKVIFQPSEDLDVNVGIDFLDDAIKGSELISVHPDLIQALKVQGAERKKIVSDYVSNYYKEHSNELETARSVFQAEWDKVQPDFFNVTDKVFTSVF